MSAVTQVAANKMFGGFSRRFTHESTSCGCKMTFTVYSPPQAESGKKVPVVYYLSGLTCTDLNFTEKAGAQRTAAALGIALVAPDTSPRGLSIEGEAESWDFGVGAGFYLNATVDKWKAWRMYDYVTSELPALLSKEFPQLDTGNASIMGHSMGGHGALTIALKNPTKYKAASAFSPICNPIAVPWGQKAFAGYLGSDESKWKAWEYDACELIKGYSGPQFPVLVDQGTADSFLETQLKPEALKAAAEAKGWPMEVRMQEGYDHSYYFIATFIEDHLRHHAKALGVAA